MTVVLGSMSEVLDLGRAVRLFTPGDLTPASYDLLRQGHDPGHPR